MNKLKNAIVNNNDNTEVDDDTLLSYYDLLTYLKSDQRSSRRGSVVNKSDKEP